jgi:hypothetical protein
MWAALLVSVVAALAWGQATPAKLLFFVTSDCPLSNFYASDIQQICAEYGRKGIACSLVYEDVRMDERMMRRHMADYGYQGLTAVIDGDRAIARRVGASVTPQAIVVGANGEVRYRGRLDNRYEELGKPRRVVTAHDLRDALDALVAGKPVARPETTALGCYIVSPDVPRKLP